MEVAGSTGTTWGDGEHASGKTGWTLTGDPTVKTFPPIPRIEDAPADLLESGHLWVLEKIDGAHLRFRLQESGLIRFGDRGRVYEHTDALPDAYNHAVRHVRERLDRDALHGALAKPEDVVFFGEATHRHTIEYDWDRTPSFLGFEIWNGTAGRFLSPDRVEQIFDRLNLHRVNAFQRELPARDFQPERYEMPQSAWYEGPPEGVILRDKTGNRAELRHPEFEKAEAPAPAAMSGSELARAYATERRFEKIISRLAANEDPPTFDSLYERSIEDIHRETPDELDRVEDLDTFHDELAELTGQFLDRYQAGE